jgi:branched-chain amino acid transport system permease protein
MLDTIVSIAFSGIAFAMVLYIVSVGLSITMGLLGVVNLAHGAFAMAGGYIVYTLVNQQGYNFFLSLAAGSVLVGLCSVGLERLLYSRVYKAGELDQVLLTIGLIFVSIAMAHFIYGSLPLSVALPAVLDTQVDFAGYTFPVYRLFLIVIGFMVFFALWFGIERTNVGANVRAAVENRSMAEAVGINTRRLFTVVFSLCSALAAMGGALGAGVITLTPSYPLNFLVYFLIVVAVGGLGSVKGPLFAALLLGLSDSACKILAPEFGAFFIYVAVFVLLFLRPNGLFGRA